MKMLRLFAIAMMSFLLVAPWAAMVSALTHNTPTIDGTINIATDDWDSDENMGDSGGTSGRNLYVTWDATNLYVGITGANSGSVDVYIDTATGGTQQSFPPPAPDGFPIASGSGGYEFLWRINNAGQPSWRAGSTGSWENLTYPTGIIVHARGAAPDGDLELQIPFTELTGYSPGNRLSLLVLSGTNPSVVQYYWPALSGNTITPSPSFTQAFIFANAGVANISPNAAPTAVTLHSFTANNLANTGIVVGSTILLFGISLYILRRRDTK